MIKSREKIGDKQRRYDKIGGSRDMVIIQFHAANPFMGRNVRKVYVKRKKRPNFAPIIHLR